MINSIERQRGECSLCCKTMAIPELEKPKGVWCSHVIKKRGCAIYDARPQACRTFKCLWLQDPSLPPEWQPNRSKFVLVGKSANELVVYVDPNSPGAWREEPFLTGLRAMAATGQSHGGLVVVVERSSSTVVLADREAPLGVLQDDDRVVSGTTMTLDGPKFEVKVIKAGDAAQLVDAVSSRLGPK